MTAADDDWYERQVLEAEDRDARLYRATLAAHPDCNDPDHPGCSHCEPTEDNES